jgi:hypothetical protein
MREDIIKQHWCKVVESLQKDIINNPFQEIFYITDICYCENIIDEIVSRMNKDGVKAEMLKTTFIGTPYIKVINKVPGKYQKYVKK